MTLHYIIPFNINFFYHRMGNCNSRKPVPPPNSDMIGEWLLNPKSRHFHIGSGNNRYKKGSNLLGVGLAGPSS